MKIKFDYRKASDNSGYDDNGEFTTSRHRDRNFKLVLQDEEGPVAEISKERIEEWIETCIEDLENYPDDLTSFITSGDTAVFVIRDGDEYSVFVTTPRMTGYAVTED